MSRAIFQLLLALVLFVGGALEALAAKRVALVIGNSAYEHTRRLPNPKNDATAIAESLKRLGFDSVTLKLDQSYGPMRDTIRAFGREARNADVALIYYAGHGLELGRLNYLVPVDAKLETDDDLRFEAVTLDDVLLSVRRARQLRLVILDACRNNPLSTSMEVAGGVTRSVSRGFGRIEPSGDVLVAYAAKHGTVAEDGDGSHSPFASALLQHMSTPGLEVNFLFRKVRDSVRKATNRRQEPFTYGSLGGESVYLVPPPVDDFKKPSAKVPLSPAAQAWEAVKQTEDPAVLDAFLKEYPNGVFAALAKSRLKKLKEHDVAVGVFPKTPKPSVGQKFEPGKEFQDCPDCPKMVVVPPGSFTMGSPETEKDRDNSEGPQQRVTIPQAFAVGKFEVTVDQFAAFVQDSRYDAGHRCHVLHRQHGWQQDGGRNFQNPGFSQTGSHPAACVNWDDAKAYAAWISRKTGKTYRLLSEAEWEYAARSGSMTRFHFGDRDKDLCGYANIADRSSSFDWKNKSCSDGVGNKTARVGRYKANSFGLHDLYGNIWEWVEDCWNADYANATKGNAPRTSGDCSSRVLRGGAWANLAGSARSASRNRSITYFRYSSHGFRIARTLNP